MFFRDMIVSDAQWRGYEDLLSKLSLFVSDCVRFLIDAFDAAHVKAATERRYSHATVLMLIRHVIESIDGVSVLVAEGCAENCGPLLRSAFEGQLGVLHILQADTEGRALAYQLAHAHRQIKLYRRLDANDSLGKQMRAELKDDPMAEIFNRSSAELPSMIANLQNMFKKTEFVPIEQEWQALRKQINRDPEWFALFYGPRNVRALALSLKLGAAYEGLYRSWSDVIHAGSGMKHVGPSDQPDAISIRPIRHPEGLENVCSLAAQICLNTARNSVEHYAPEELLRFDKNYLENLRTRYLDLCQRKLIDAPWR